MSRIGAVAFIHRATLHPTKLELLAAWLPTCDWYAGPADSQIRVAGYRLDDPAGEVGLLIGTSEHSVLGKRWIVVRRLGGCTALAGTVLAGTWPGQPVARPLAAAIPLVGAPTRSSRPR